MLSILLKLFANRDERGSAVAELHPDTEFSLSMIDSGCLFVVLGQRAALVIKSGIDEIQIMKDFQAITIDFELIQRPEFPSLVFFLNVEAGGGRKFRFEYFFRMESEDEAAIVRKMCSEKRFDIIFYSSAPEFVIHAEIPEAQASELRALCDRARS